MVVSNNGPAFVSNEFEESMRKNGIRHVKAVPYHPALNGLVERAVQTLKTAMKKQSLQTRLSRFLFKYRITPHTTTDQSSAQLRWGTQLRSHLTLLHLEVGKTVRYAQNRQKIHHDQYSRQRTVSMWEDVLVREYANYKPSWTTGKVIEKTGPISSKIQLNHYDKVVLRHQEQIRRSTPNNSPKALPEVDDDLNAPAENSTEPSTIPKSDDLKPVESTKCYPTR